MMLLLVVLLLTLSQVSAEFLLVNTTILHNAVEKGAVCLDGSAPAYLLDRGTGYGVNNWLVHIEVTGLHFRGARVFLAIMEDLLYKGMWKAENAILSGTSAGGLASILHCITTRPVIGEFSGVLVFHTCGWETAGADSKKQKGGHRCGQGQEGKEAKVRERMHICKPTDARIDRTCEKGKFGHFRRSG
nr:pectin acetylesterase 8-like [Nicotiana tomentosiformis]